MIAAGVRLDHAGVDCETVAAHQPRLILRSSHAAQVRRRVIFM